MKTSIVVVNKNYTWAMKYFIPMYLTDLGITYNQLDDNHLSIPNETEATSLIIHGFPDYIADYACITHTD
jgi:hypothetical protein